MPDLIVSDGHTGYVELLDYVKQHGTPREARGLKTIDAGQTTIVLRSPRNALPLYTGRQVSRRVAAAEAIQLIGGFSQPNLLPPSFNRFKEDDGSFWGAYGNRIGRQLEHVVRKLRDDPGTRQAVITLWNPEKDNVPGKRDYPCTVSFTFEMWRGTLDLHVVMRSSDAWLGIPYDWFQFTQMQLTVANLLNADAGTYWHTSQSLHIYEENLPRTDAVTVPTRLESQPDGIGSPTTLEVEEVRYRAYAISGGAQWFNFTQDERWYVDALRS